MSPKTALGVILLLGLVVACSPAARSTQETLPETPDPDPEDAVPEAIVPGPMVVTLTVSNGLRDADQATLMDALTTWEEATNGQVRLEAVFGDTQCGQSYAIHLADPDECGMTCDRVNDLGQAACADGESIPPWRITLRKGLNLDRLYFNAVHELGHALGLEHGDGFMRLKGDDLTQTFLTKAQLDTVARVNHLDREAMPESIAFPYENHRERAAPFITYD